MLDHKFYIPLVSTTKGEKMTNQEKILPSFQTLFKKNSRILQRESLLSLNFFPDIVVARDNQMHTIAQNLSSILNNGDPANMYIWGDTGVGKTITIKHVLKILTYGIKEDGQDILINIVILNWVPLQKILLSCKIITNHHNSEI